MKNKDPERHMIFFPHWGENYKWKHRKQVKDASKIFSWGADLIIGHGAHMIQELEILDDRLVIYSLGNFVFNSPGRHRLFKDSSNYSMVSQLVFYQVNKKLEIKLKLYPILTNNF